MNWKKMWSLGLALFTMTTISGHAENYVYQDGCCPESFDCCSDKGISIYGDWLYWTTRRCSLDYALPYDGSNALGHVYQVCPSYSNGFRIGVEKECNCMLFGVEYAHYGNDERDRVSDVTFGNIAGTKLIDAYTVVSQGTMELAQSRWCMDYDTVALTSGYNTSWGCLDTKFFGGLKLAFIEQKQNTLYSALATMTTGIDYVDQKIKLDAYGINLGIAPSYNICDCLDAFGWFSYDILAGNFKKNFIYRTTANGGSTIMTRARLYEDCWRLISVFNLALGLRYNWCFCNKEFDLSLGYEFHHWLDGFGFLEHQNESGEITVDRYNDPLGLDGLFLRFGVKF